MGHMISGFYTSKTKEGAAQQLLSWSEDNYDRQETSHGLDGVVWKNHICDSPEEAETYLKQFIDEVYWQNMGVGVAFRCAKKMPKPTQQYQKAVEALQKNQMKLQQSQSTIHYRNTKQKTVSCRHCGYRFNVAELFNNYCPVCRKDMRPETILKKEEDLRTNINYYYKRIQAFERDMQERAYKNKDNVQTMYMTVGSIHC